MEVKDATASYSLELIAISLLLMIAVGLLRRRSERMRRPGA